MPLTVPFHKTVQERARRDPLFRKGLLKEAAECFLNGEIGVCRSLLNDYVMASVGIGGLAEMTGRSPRSLMRLLSRTGNPQARTLLEVIQRLREHEDIRFEVTALEGAEEPQEEDEESEGVDSLQPTAAVR